MKALLLTAALFANGCVFGIVSTPSHNAPGNIDVAAPPAAPAPRTAMQPADPGTELLRASLRGFVGGGIAAGGGRTLRSSYSNGLELNLSYGRDLDPSLFWGASDHYAMLPSVSDRWYGRRAIGVTVGWVPYVEDDQPARAYAELEIDRMPFGLGLGYVWEPSGRARGAQSTFSLGPLYLRGTYLDPRGTSLAVGIDLVAATAAIAWSR